MIILENVLDKNWMFIIWYKFFLIKCTKYIYWQLCPCTKVLKYLYNFFKFIYIYFYKISILWYMHEKMLHSLSQENYAIHDSFFFENRRVYICLDRKKNDITIRACYTDSAFQRWYQRWQRVSRTSLSGHISSIVLDVVSIS